MTNNNTSPWRAVMALVRGVVAVLLCLLPVLYACAFVSAQTEPVAVIDYSFFTGNLDSTGTPVTRVNGYLNSTNSARFYMRVQCRVQCSLMPQALIIGRFYGPNGRLVQEVTRREASDTSVWIFETEKLGNVENSTGIWKFEVYDGPVLVLVEYFSVGDYPVSVSIRGFSSEFAVKVAVDGKEAGTIRGGEKKVSALSTGAHTVSVGTVVNATSWTRYTIKNNSWNVSSRSSHAFVYLTQYYLNVTSPYGKTTGSGWYNNGTRARFAAASPVAGGPGIRYVFANWTGNIDQYTNASDRRTMTMINGPKNFAANYRTQYYLRVKSQFDSPNGKGWYDQGSTATVSVPPSNRLPDKTYLLLPDGSHLFLPTGTQVFFVSWSGDIVSSNNTATILMDKPHDVVANWEAEAAPGQLLDWVVGAFIITLLVLLVVVISQRKHKLIQRIIGAVR